MTEHHDSAFIGTSDTITKAWFEHGTSRIYYEDDGSGEAILLLPGLFGSIAEFPALRAILKAAGYRIITADLPGSGRSEPQPRAYTATYYQDDARTFLALLQSLGVSSAHLMGFSDGGEVGLLMAALSPSSARSIVAWGAVGTLHDPEGFLRDALYNLVDNPLEMFQDFRTALVAAYGEATARFETQSVSRAFTAIIEAGNDISLSKVRDITCPVLLIAGEFDPLALPALVAELASRIPTAEMLEVKGAGHDPLHSTRTEWLAQTILAWIERHS